MYKSTKAHPNKAYFTGVLTFLDVASDSAPGGGRGHKVVLTKRAATKALSTLIGMGVCLREDLQGHDAASKIGVIDSAKIQGNQLTVTGYLFKHDMPSVIERLSASEDLGMSYELANVRVEDMRASVWTLLDVTFTGAAILSREKAAYKTTRFELYR